ncbi:MAG TPA: leucyl aminopeptidase [Sulfurivirga caldicuralii]|nr:leucyl aminopeptidase [Sulfurivirga caldicuralii]
MKAIQFDCTLNPSDFDTLVVPVYADGSSNAAAATYGVNGLIQALVEQKDFQPKVGHTLMLHTVANLNCPRLLLVGLGEAEKLTVKKYLDAVNATASALDHSGARHALITLNSEVPNAEDSVWALYHNTLQLQRSFYDYSHESRGDRPERDPVLTAVTFWAEDTPAHRDIITQAQATAFGMALTQDLANLPPNICTPQYLADTAVGLGQIYGFEVEVIEREEMERLGMGALLAVARGSEAPPKLISLRYNGAGDAPPIALVGKGVTFDSGGISLKPGAGMDEMKYDMAGAAAVLGTFKALGELKPKLNVVAVIPATENMPSGKAAKPGDVITSLSGQTIEILNTDAEGRLILCDALTWAQRQFKPAKIVDLATLTGACIIALGHHISGLMSNDKTLAETLQQTGEWTYDRLWRLPLSEEYDQQLKSNFADMANIGGRPAGTITAGQFLARFIEDNRPWAHLDIAGTAWLSGDKKGATGRPVPTLIAWLLSEAAT